MPRDKTILVTGTLGGIGAASAKAVAGIGADVMLNRFGFAEMIAEQVAETEALGMRCAHFDTDPHDKVAIAEMIAAIPGGPDILVNNAVVRIFGATEAFDPAHWNEALAVSGAWMMSR